MEAASFAMEAAAAAASRRAPCFVSPHSNGSDVAHRNRRSVPAVRLRPWRDGGRMRPRHPNANPRTCHQSARDRISQRQLRLSPSRSCISIRPCLNVKKAVTALPWSSLCLEPKTHGAMCSFSLPICMKSKAHNHKKKSTTTSCPTLSSPYIHANIHILCRPLWLCTTI